MSLSAPLPKRTKPRFSLLWLFALCIANVGLWLWGGQATEAAIYQGFGATTPGGAKGMVVHVTNLNDSGPGSLRAAVSQEKRTIVFDVGGTIVLASMIPAKGSFITIDGFSAPPPGITLVNAGLKITGTSNAHVERSEKLLLFLRPTQRR